MNRSHRFRSGGLFLMPGCLVLLAAGCANLTAVNPSFELSHADAQAELKAMRAEPVPLERPLIFLGPFVDPFIAELVSVGHAKKYFTDDQNIGGVSFVLWDNFDACRAKTIRKVDRLFPSADPDSIDTVEVDVIGFSMGGLVARYAALPPDPERGQTRRLKINRLYTIASPHRGANWAALGPWISLANDMKSGSDFLARLDAGRAEADYELVPYTRLGDWVVGPENTSPPDEKPVWVSARAFEMAHIQAAFDARIQADILARLRGQPAFADPQPAPLPGEE
ncbi:MAG: hypothetical protein AAF911_13840 [Planctomycetota bacterium]